MIISVTHTHTQKEGKGIRESRLSRIQVEKNVRKGNLLANIADPQDL